MYSVTGVGLLANTMITPNIPDVLADLGRSDGSAGFLVASGALPGVILAPVIGILADRFGRKRVLLPCLLLFAIGSLVGSLAPNFETLIAGRLLQGAGGAGLINLALVLIGDHWDGLDRTRLIGRNSAVLTFSLAVLPLVSGLIAEVGSWRASVAVGLFALPVAAAGLIVLPDSKPGVTITVRQQIRGAVQASRRPILLFVFLAIFLLFVVIFGVFLTALPVHLEEEFGLGPGARGLVLSLSALGAVVTSFNLGRLREVVPLRALLVVSCLLIAMAAFGVAVAPILALVIVAMLLYGVGDGIIIPALQDVASSVPKAEQRASVMAAWVVAVRLGQTVGPLGAALIFARSSTSVAMLVGAAVFAVVALMFTVGPVDDEALRAESPQPSG
jgi:MFS family permease